MFSILTMNLDFPDQTSFLDINECIPAKDLFSARFAIGDSSDPIT